MQACHLTERKQQGDMANLRASSLDTLLQLVAAGYGTTLIPATALTGSWASGSGIITRELNLPDTWRDVALYSRPGFPRKEALKALTETILSSLPNPVKKRQQSTIKTIYRKNIVFLTFFRIYCSASDVLSSDFSVF